VTENNDRGCAITCARIFYRYFQLHSTYILTILAFATRLSTHTVSRLSLDSRLSPSPRHLRHSHTTLFSHSTLTHHSLTTRPPLAHHSPSRFSHSTLTHHSPLAHHSPTTRLRTMPLTTIIWNGVYNTRPLMRLLAEYRIREHYQNSWYLQMKGVEIADLRYVLFYLFKSLCTHNAQQDRVSRSLARRPPHGRLSQGGSQAYYDAPCFPTLKPASLLDEGRAGGKGKAEKNVDMSFHLA